MDILTKDHALILQSFDAHVAKFLPNSNALIVSFDVSKQTDSDKQKFDDAINSDLANAPLIISSGHATCESSAGTDYTVNSVESIAEQSPFGLLGDAEILLFNVVSFEQWEV